MKHIQKIQLLLTTLLMAKEFQNRSLIDNKKLMTDLKEFQDIIFDRKQRYGNPNYEPVPLEKDLEQVENHLAQVIYEQLNAINMTTLSPYQLMELYKDYETHCLHRKVNYSGKVNKTQSNVLPQILMKTKELEDIDQKVSFLNFITGHSNSGHKEHGEAKKLLKELGYPEKTFI